MINLNHLVLLGAAVAKQLQALYFTSNTLSSSCGLSSIIKYYYSKGSYIQFLLLYTRVHLERAIHPMLPMAIKACASLSLLSLARSLHAESIKAGQDSDVMVGTSLISMYWKCHDLAHARELFDGMPERNAVTYNTMISGYSENGDMASAWVLFDRMVGRTQVTWVLMIEGLGKVNNTLAARWLFDQIPAEVKTVAVWTAMVHGYTINGEMDAARKLFDEMPSRNCFVWSSMVAGYFKTGDVEEGASIFHRIPRRNSVNWNALIAGYAQNGCFVEALEAVSRMMEEDGFEPDEVTIASALSACAQLGSLSHGRKIHELVEEKGVKMNQFVVCGLVDMYAKCGDIEQAVEIFKGMKMYRRNLICWNTMISGLSNHGMWKETLDLFAEMELEEKPDNITFLAVLSACTHGGFVKVGLEVFDKMKAYGLVPQLGHYGCLVDLLGRAGRLNEAYDVIHRMPIKPNDVILGGFLGACRIHSDAYMAERIVKEFNADFCTQSSQDATFVTLSNIYAASDRWEDAAKLRIVKKGYPKFPGCSFVVTDS